jgi:hypothetical protein
MFHAAADLSFIGRITHYYKLYFGSSKSFGYLLFVSCFFDLADNVGLSLIRYLIFALFLYTTKRGLIYQ